MKTRKLFILSLIAGVLLLGGGALLLAEDSVPQPVAPVITDPSPMHPTFALLDADGQSVLDTGKPISTMQTCGACHDTEFIATHSYHSDVGLSSFGAESLRVWDTSPGSFGRFSPVTYEYITPQGTRPNLTTAMWIQKYGARHVGGGPATTARDGQPLTSLEIMADNVETSVIDPLTGASLAWDWSESGVVEMNCFLCHTAQPNNEARLNALEAGAFGWANTATLAGTGIVNAANDTLTYNPDAFSADGQLLPEFVTVQDPTIANCGACHGAVETSAQIPLALDPLNPSAYNTLTTGQIISPQKIMNSALNLAGKNTLARSWDVHAERVVECTDCHYALNNPVYYREDDASQPEHLTFDPRRLDFGEYVRRPLHQFAKGESVTSALAPEYDNTLRRCESCHSIENTHTWLPYRERHTTELACESCHIPKMYAPALQSVDWTVMQVSGEPMRTYRGIDASGLITGFEPVLLPRANADGTTALAPHNLITAFYWVYGEPAQPVPLIDLQAAWLDGDDYRADVLAAFDADQDGTLNEAELVIDSDAKIALIAQHLTARGLENPRMVGDVQPYSINHGVTHGDWATRDCQTCHAEDSRLAAALPLANHTPNGVTPTFVGMGGDYGSLTGSDSGVLYFQPVLDADKLYIFGHDYVDWIDNIGMLLFIGTFLGVIGHGGLRYVMARRGAQQHAHTRYEKVYMYSVYERQWHWLQTVLIFGMIFTGLVIHKPDKFGIFSFPFIVEVHNILALILVLNAALALFYHLASGQIRQFLPEPHGFFNQAILQAKFYMNGIFKGAGHPFEKSADHKMNPLQQVTYLGLLNVLLPAQIITGILMWGAQQFPLVTDALGGLGFLAPLHTLIAWLFATFIVAHVYLTTTAGRTPLTDIQAMITGWDEVEVNPNASAAAQSSQD